MNWYDYNTLILIILSLLLYVYRSFKKSHSYFERNGIPYIKPNFFFGNITDVFLRRKTVVQVYTQLYNELHPHKFAGIYLMRKPAILLRDPELIKTILIKDFKYFHDRSIPVVKEVDPLSHNLFNIKGNWFISPYPNSDGKFHHIFLSTGEEWKKLRVKLTGAFTTGKMRMMLPLVTQCGEKLINLIDQSNDESLDVKDLAARFITDAISTCAFGLDVNSLQNPDSEFYQFSKKIFQFRFQNMIRLLWPTAPNQLIKLFRLSLFDSKVQNYFRTIVEKTVEYRECNKITRNDFLDWLIALKNNVEIEKSQGIAETEDLDKFKTQLGEKFIKSDIDITIDVIAAQSFVSFAAGFESSSTAIAQAMLELAQNQLVQNKVHDEIKSVLNKYDGQLTYEALKQMTYLDMVVAETLRKHPAAGFLFRKCTRSYKVPDSEVIIPPETTIVIPLYGIQWDEQYYHNPHEFRPERFTEKEKSKRPNLSYMPFGDGPRVCIGERFANMQLKVGLIYMLKGFSYRMSPKMKFPLQYENSFGVQVVRGGIWLRREKLT